jgi:hypothetical protein
LALFLSNLELLLFLVLADGFYSNFAAKFSKNFIFSFVDGNGQLCDSALEVCRYIPSLMTSSSMYRKLRANKKPYLLEFWRNIRQLLRELG